MSATKKEKSIASTGELEQQEATEKTCFIIMPIADHPKYDEGHFNRVYEYLIKPACKNAGYKAIRADDSKASHMIMFDILKKIVECDMAICDLSTKNANVFYELGLRQAFNKKTILITDGEEKEPFDVTGFRYVKYDKSLRIDTVNNHINSISSMIEETEIADENDINSVVSLLKIKPASIDKTKDIQLSKENTIIFNMLNEMNKKINANVKKNNIDSSEVSLYELMEREDPNIYDYSYSSRQGFIGRLKSIGANIITFKDGNDTYRYMNDDLTKKNIKTFML